jgi:hypothetical protein
MFWDQAQNRMEWPDIVADQGCPNEALPNWNIRVCYETYGFAISYEYCCLKNEYLLLLLLLVLIACCSWGWKDGSKLQSIHL